MDHKRSQVQSLLKVTFYAKFILLFPMKVFTSNLVITKNSSICFMSEAQSNTVFFLNGQQHFANLNMKVRC